MSNWKHAYGWSGHIIASSHEVDSNPDENVVAIPPSKFAALAEAFENCEIDERIEVRQLGVESAGEIIFLAVGSCFSEGFTHYGTIFTEAETRAEHGQPQIDHDSEYMLAMKEIYGLKMPPCRLMIGCASEH